MRFSILQSASLAFLSLSSVFHGGNALPAGADTLQNESSTHQSQKITARAKPVPRLVNYGYVARENIVRFPGTPTRWTIEKASSVKGYIDEIWIDSSLGIITIDNANNLEDTTDNRLSLSDIAMSLFVYQGRNQPLDLKRVAYAHVLQDDAFKFLQAALKLDTEHSAESLTFTVSRSSEVEIESWIFNGLNEAPFGKSLRWMNIDFGVPLVTSYTISGTPGQPNYYATLG